MKRLFIFDLDGTLAESKMPVSISMAETLKELLSKTKVAIISGASYTQFAGQFVRHIHASPEILSNLYLLPANGTTLHIYEGGWKKEYDHLLTEDEVAEIYSAIESTIAESKMQFPYPYGDRIENRGSQISFSALGQHAPLAAKKDWDPDLKKRIFLKSILEKKLSNFTIAIGGTTTIDITKKGLDKLFGINEVMKRLQIPKESVVYIGDALFPGGNDSKAKEAGIETIQVSGPENTERLIKEYLKNGKI